MMAQPLSTPLDAAEMFTARGWVVFPCDHPDAGLHCTGTARACREKRCKAEADPSQRGKHPRVRWGDLGEPVDSGVLRAWFGRDAIPTNVAIACGPSGLLIVDEDTDGALSAYAESIGQVVPDTFRVRTARGWHWYFTVPVDAATGRRIPIGNSPGALAAWHCDVRGGASASATHGGYVITAGSKHASDLTYTAPEPYAAAVQAPGWLIEAILSPVPHSPGPPATAEGPTAGAGTVGGVLSASDGARWDDAPRYGSAHDLLGQFARHCGEVTEPGGAFRHTLFRAARDGWRCVALGLLDEDAMLRELEACVWRVWQAEPDDDDHKIVFEEAVPAALASPWELSGAELRARAGTVQIEPGRTFLRSSEAASLVDRSSTAPGVTSDDDPDDLSMVGNPTVAPATDREDELYAKDLVRRIRDERLRRDAKEAVDALGRSELLVVRPSQRKDRPRASYLVPKMIYRNGLAVIFGETQSGKSYLALDIALCFATGKPWRGHRITKADGGRGMVHYVMAEGEDANNGRMDAWLYHHGLTDEDIEETFAYIPQVIPLTDVGIEQYLRVVRQDRPDLIILDTRNLMFMGSEAAGGDQGAMLRTLRTLETEAQGCAIILIDHPGLNDLTRARGGNAQKGGADTEISVTKVEGLHTAEVTKDRSAAMVGTQWHYRLHQIDEIPREAFVDPPAVCIEAHRDPMIAAADWWQDQLPEELAELITKSPLPAKRAALEVMRVLRKIGMEFTVSVSEMDKMLRERPRARKGEPYWSLSTIRNAMTLLTDAAAVDSAGTEKVPRWRLALTWRSTS